MLYVVYEVADTDWRADDLAGGVGRVTEGTEMLCVYFTIGT